MKEQEITQLSAKFGEKIAGMFLGVPSIAMLPAGIFISDMVNSFFPTSLAKFKMTLTPEQYLWVFGNVPVECLNDTLLNIRSSLGLYIYFNMYSQVYTMEHLIPFIELSDSPLYKPGVPQDMYDMQKDLNADRMPVFGQWGYIRGTVNDYIPDSVGGLIAMKQVLPRLQYVRDWAVKQAQAAGKKEFQYKPAVFAPGSDFVSPDASENALNTPAASVLFPEREF